MAAFLRDIESFAAKNNLKSVQTVVTTATGKRVCRTKRLWWITNNDKLICIYNITVNYSTVCIIYNITSEFMHV